jgi:hypothetical protein
LTAKKFYANAWVSLGSIGQYDERDIVSKLPDQTVTKAVHPTRIPTILFELLDFLKTFLRFTGQSAVECKWVSQG